MMYASDDEWGEFLLIDSNLCCKCENRRRRWMHQMGVKKWERIFLIVQDI